MTNTEGSDIPNSHTERKPGYYWVRTEGTRWRVRYYEGEYVWIIGEGQKVDDTFWTEIDPTPITRQSSPVSVDINQDLVEALTEIVAMPTPLTISDAMRLQNIAFAALSRAQKPERKGPGFLPHKPGDI